MKLITFRKNDKLLSNKDQLSLLKDDKIFVGEWCINQENIPTEIICKNLVNHRFYGCNATSSCHKYEVSVAF